MVTDEEAKRIAEAVGITLKHVPSHNPTIFEWSAWFEDVEGTGSTPVTAIRDLLQALVTQGEA